MFIGRLIHSCFSSLFLTLYAVRSASFSASARTPYFALPTSRVSLTSWRLTGASCLGAAGSGAGLLALSKRGPARSSSGDRALHDYMAFSPGPQVIPVTAPLDMLSGLDKPFPCPGTSRRLPIGNLVNTGNQVPCRMVLRNNIGRA